MESMEYWWFFIAILPILNIMLSFYIHTTTYYEYHVELLYTHYYSYMYVHELITIHIYVYRCHWLKGSFDYEA